MLVVEVAETSYRIDREYKASRYARGGIPECWIVDLVHATLEMHREPEASPTALYGWRYANAQTLRPPTAVAPLVAPGSFIAVTDLLT